MPAESKFQPKEWLTTIIVGKKPTQYPSSKKEWDTLLKTAAINGVIALCHHQMTKTAVKEQCPNWFCDELKKHTQQLAVSEMAQSHELKQVLAEFAQADIFPLLMKGAPLFSYEEFVQHAIPIPSLGVNARTLEPVHALLLACMHRVGHLKGGTGNRLLWLYDIHLLAGQFSEKQWMVFEELTLERNLESVCLDSIETTRKAFKTKIPENILQTLRSKSRKGGYAPQNANQIWQAQLMNLRSLPGWRARIKLLREQFFPPSKYMLEKYQIKYPVLLPAYYVLRIIQGIPKLFRNLKQTG